MKPAEMLGVILRAGGILSLSGFLSDFVRGLWLTIWGHTWTPGDTWARALTGMGLYAVYAAFLLLGADRITRLLYPRD
jgi:hypothetical protein